MTAHSGALYGIDGIVLMENNGLWNPQLLLLQASRVVADGQERQRVGTSIPDTRSATYKDA